MTASRIHPASSQGSGLRLNLCELSTGLRGACLTRAVASAIGCSHYYIGIKSCSTTTSTTYYLPSSYLLYSPV